MISLGPGCIHVSVLIRDKMVVESAYLDGNGDFADDSGGGGSEGH